MTTRQYVIDGLTKYTVQDDWETGHHDIGQKSDINAKFLSNDLNKLISDVANFLDITNHEHIFLNNNEKNQIQFCVMENDNGEALSEREFEAWKNGKGNAWSSLYNAYIFELIPVDVSTIKL